MKNWAMTGIVLAAAIVSATAAAEHSAQQALSSELAKQAAALQPGKWVELKTTGLTKELSETSKGYSIFGWSDDAVWDPCTNQLLFMGFRQELKFVAYDEAKNAWHAIKPYDSKATFGHPYGNNALNAAAGMFYNLECGSNQIHAFDTRKQEWSKLPPCTLPCQGLGLAIEYFPEMNALIFLYSKQLYKLDMATQKWSVLAKGVPVGAAHVTMRYNAKHKCIFMGGGNEGMRKIAVLEASGEVAPKQDAPFDLKMTTTKVVADTATGDFVALAEDHFFSFDSVKNTWTSLGSVAKDTPIKDSGTVVAPVDKYGVSMWVEAYTSQKRVHLYKYAKPASAK